MKDKKLLGYLGVDQYGQCWKIKKHPRKELMEQLGSTGASIMYCDTLGGETRRIGYVISGLWIDVFKVYPAYREGEL